MRARVVLAAAIVAGLLAGCSSTASHGGSRTGRGHASPTLTGAGPASLRVTWMRGTPSPGTPAKYDRIGVLKVGAPTAKNVLVLEPGTSAGSAYFVPLAEWLTDELPGWQVWSIERRENLLETQKELNLGKQHKASEKAVFDYYLGYIRTSKITHHFQPVTSTSVEFAKTWGMAVAVGDLHIVISDAEKLGGKVVLGGHSLGGSVITAYATWDFGGKPGADGLAGLVWITGGSFLSAPSGSQADATLTALRATNASPWLNFGGIGAPYAGQFISLGSLAALEFPNTPSLGQTSGLLPPILVPRVRASNVGQLGFALNAATSPPSLLAAQAHLGKGLSAKGPVHRWTGAGALTPIQRYATMFSGYPLLTVTGSEWYFPQRLTDDTAAVDEGNANPAQTVLSMHATLGHQLPKSLLFYAFGGALGGTGVLTAAKVLARQSGIPASHLTLVTEKTTYSHNDPAAAYPHNVFFTGLVSFLNRAGAAHG